MPTIALQLDTIIYKHEAIRLFLTIFREVFNIEKYLSLQSAWHLKMKLQGCPETSVITNPHRLNHNTAKTLPITWLY